VPGLSTVKTACVFLSPLAFQRATAHKAVKAKLEYQNDQGVPFQLAKFRMRV